MRLMTCIVALGLLLAVTVPAEANGIPFRQAYSGPVLMHVSNFAMGTTYTGNVTTVLGLQPAYSPVFDAWVNPATGAYGGAGFNSAPYYSAAILQVAAGATGAKPGEDGWGIFRVDAIYAAVDHFNNTIDTPTTLLFAKGDSGIDLVGSYFNRNDLQVKFLANDYSQQAFDFNGDTVEMFTQGADTGWNAVVAAGSAARLAGANIDKLTGIGYDGAGALRTDGAITAERVLTAVGQVGYFGQAAAAEGEAVFYAAGPFSGSGHADQYYNTAVGTYGTGTLNNFWNTNIFNPTKVGIGVPADFRIHVTDTPTTTADWLTSSSDPLTGSVVPEPVTMMGLFLAVGGIGGYIRRRMA